MQLTIPTILLALAAYTTASTKETATFDDAPQGAPPTPYHRLVWRDTYIVAANPAITPSSGTQYAASSTAPTNNVPLISFSVNSTTSPKPDYFDLDSLTLGAAYIIRNGYRNTKVQFTVQCTKSSGHEGPQLLEWVPDKSQGATMKKYDVGFKGCKNAWLNLYTAEAGVPKTVLYLDDVKVTAYP